MVADLEASWRSCKTNRGEDVRKLGEEVRDTLWGRDERVAWREEDGGGEDVRFTEGEKLLKTFRLAMFRRRL